MKTTIKQIRNIVTEVLRDDVNIHCKDCKGCKGCNNCVECSNCVQCIDCLYCMSCSFCTNCIECSGLSGQRYMIGNQQLTQQEYLRRAKEEFKL